jgi:NCS1 family nucleobase:cation symporter-1
MDTQLNDVKRVTNELAEKHHAPKSVEQFGVEAVPQELRKTGWWDLFGVMLSFQLNPLTFILPASAVIVGGLSWWGAIMTQLIGVSFIIIAFLTISTYGVDYGIPGQVGNRFAFGPLGAKILPSFMRVIASTYWFAFQTLAVSTAIQGLLQQMIGVNIGLVKISIVFAIFQIIVALLGWEGMKAASRVVLPLKVILLLAVLYLFFTSKLSNFSPAHVFGMGGHDSWLTWAPWIGAAIANQTTMLTDAADVSRYGSSRKAVWTSFFAAEIVSVLLAGIIGVYAAIAVHTSNPLTTFSTVSPGLWWLVVVLIIFVVDIWYINIMNLYTGGFSLVNIFPKVGRFWSTVIIAVASLILCGFPVFVNNSVSIINDLGLLFAPVGGILIAHYLFIIRGKINLAALFEEKGVYGYTRGVNIVAVVMTGVGVLIDTHLPQNVVPAASGLIISGILYYVVMRIVRERLPSIKKAFDNSGADTPYAGAELSNN